jgi:hypothetical protein
MSKDRTDSPHPGLLRQLAEKENMEPTDLPVGALLFYTCRSIILSTLIIFLLAFLAIAIPACTSEDNPETYPFIILGQGDEFTIDGEYVPVGGQMKFALSAVGGGPAITNLRVRRILENSTITELDKGMYIATGGLDTTLVYVKSDADQETWSFFIQNENRDTSSVFITIYKGEGSAYGAINYYPSITLGYSENDQFSHFLDLKSGIVFSEDNVSGHEQDIDLAAFYYITSGKSSPTLTCPAYPSAQTYYPMFESWSVKNSTLYDYYTSDNNLVSISQFDAAENDSLLVAGYKPQNVSGLCKYCLTDKIIPFKTANGKYGMVKVIRADESNSGSMEIAIKIQQ